MNLSLVTPVDDKFAFVCDCGCSEFYLVTPNIIQCSDCDFDLPDMFWVTLTDEDIIVEIDD